MLVIIHILLILEIVRCTDDHIFETETVNVGDDITLKCTRQRNWYSTNLFWIRLVSGTFPEVLGGTLNYDYWGIVETRHVTAKQGPGTFVLHINKTRLSDSAVYYCIKVTKLKMTFLKGVFLQIKGPEPDIPAIIQVPPSDPVHPGDSVTLQCSVLSDTEKKTCPGDHSVYWFRTRSDESHPTFIYAHGKSGDQCEKSPEAQSTQKCVYNFSKNVSSSDAGTYHCAVATCAEILFGNGTKRDIGVVSKCHSQKDNTIVPLLCAALAVSLIVTAFLICVIRKQSCDCCSTVVGLQADSGNQQSQQRNENSLVYSTMKFTRTAAGKAGTRNAAAREQTVYADVRAFLRD